MDSLNKDDFFNKKEKLTDTNENTCNTTINSETNSVYKDEFHVLNIEKDVVINKDNYIRYYQPKKIGNVFAFWYKNGEPKIIIGPHCNLIFILGPFFACLSSFITLVSIIYFFSLWSKLNQYVKVIGVLLYFLQITSYTLTFLINPGLPKKETHLKYSVKKNPFKNFRICGVCNLIMNIDDNTTHCDDCNICIEGIL